MNYLKRKLQNWLGIHILNNKTVSFERRLHELSIKIDDLYRLNKDLVSIGADIHFRSPHKIIVMSKINGGQIHFIDANFENIRELKNFVDMLKERYNTSDVTYDLPGQFNNEFTREYLTS